MFNWLRLMENGPLDVYAYAPSEVDFFKSVYHSKRKQENVNYCDQYTTTEESSTTTDTTTS